MEDLFSKRQIRYAVIVVTLALVCVISVGWNAAIPIQAAFIGGCFTLITAIGGVGVVVYQLRKQAENTIRSNRDSEAIKLKKDVYQEVLPEIKGAENARLLLASYVNAFAVDVASAAVYQSSGTKYIPHARRKTLLDLSLSSATKFTALMSVVDRWQIIDQRLTVFQAAIGALESDLHAVSSAYFNLAAIHMPLPDTNGNIEAWTAPTNEALERFNQISDAYSSVLAGVAAIISDFQIEMQNLLLGEMFHSRIPARRPVEGSRYRAVELDNHEELQRYYSERARWGNQALPWYPRVQSRP